MNEVIDGNILVLITGLFPDTATLEAALAGLGEGSKIIRHEIDVGYMDEAAWDRLLADILTSKTILTL